jgi:hypothetical protein
MSDHNAITMRQQAGLMSILNCIRNADLDRYLSRCRTVVPALDVPEAKCLALAAIRYYRGNKEARAELSIEQKLEQYWYGSLEAGKADYSVYDSNVFISELWACWVVYSRGYLRSLRCTNRLGNGISVVERVGKLRKIADLGCGVGYTTAALKELWPEATVYGTNLPGTTQYRIAKMLGQEYCFNVEPCVSTPVDLVFASEYFEHFERPVEHLRAILDVGQPRYLVVANSFGSRSIGHFNTYLDGNTKISNKAIGRRFNCYLKSRGYQQISTRFWNNRPALYERSQQ